MVFKFAKNAGERVADAMSDNFFVNIFKGDKKPDAPKVDHSDVKVAHEGDRIVLKGKTRSRADAERIVVAAGNHEGVAEVDDSALEIEDDSEPQSTFYEVKSGDTLSKIAQEHYGDAMKYPVIFEANRPMLSDPDKIYPGQVLRIPPENAATA